MHEEKTCPRCKILFECKAGNISKCNCSFARLPPELLEFLEIHYTDCLCPACLEELKNMLKAGKD